MLGSLKPYLPLVGIPPSGVRGLIMADKTRGGQFIVKETKCEDIFTPEDFNEEQLMMLDSVKEFVDKEIWHKPFRKERLRPYRRNNAKSR